ncbi:MAG: hypothetical protein MUP03_09605 [Anaerolineales bacterium]|nr:hypothetical protein [Anaerolineales bacterium]
MEKDPVFTNEMMDKLFRCKLPESKEEYKAFYEMLSEVIAVLPKIPDISAKERDMLSQKWKDIIDIVPIEGCERVTQSDLIQTLLELRVLLARRYIAPVGLSNVSAMISSSRHPGYFSFMRLKNFNSIYYDKPLCSLCRYHWDCSKTPPCPESEKFKRFLVDLLKE